MRKLIITIACAFVAQAQGGDDIYSQIRQSNQTAQITQAIEDQGKEIVRALEARNEQPRPTASFTWEETLALEAKERAARDAARAAGTAEPLPPLVLPTTPLEEYEKAKAALPAGYVIDKPNADGTITATKVH